MTTETITLEQLRAMLRDLHARMDGIEQALSAMREGLAQASATPTGNGNSNTDQVITFVAEEIILSYDDNGQPTYKAKGGAYRKYGIRIWPEVLPSLGIDPGTLKPGSNPLLHKLTLRALMGEQGPKKVIGTDLG